MLRKTLTPFASGISKIDYWSLRMVQGEDQRGKWGVGGEERGADTALSFAGLSQGRGHREKRPCQAEFPPNFSAHTLQGLLALTIQPVPRQLFRP